MARCGATCSLQSAPPGRRERTAHAERRGSGWAHRKQGHRIHGARTNRSARARAVWRHHRQAGLRLSGSFARCRKNGARPIG